MESDQVMVHGTTVDVDGTAVLIRGPSGCGKSDLALRLMDGGAVLVADDQTRIGRDGPRLFASAPGAIAGMIEVRGVGLLTVPYHDRIPLGLVVDLTQPERIERLPDRQSATFCDIPVPLLQLAAFEASAPAKIRWWISHPPGSMS